MIVLHIKNALLVCRLRNHWTDTIVSLAKSRTITQTPIVLLNIFFNLGFLVSLDRNLRSLI